MAMSDISSGEGAVLLRLMQLTSPALPVGAYAYSQGMEYAVHAGWLRDEDTAREWIIGLLLHPLAQIDVPVFARLYTAWRAGDERALDHWSALLKASRESRELQEEDRQLGMALARLLCDLGLEEAAAWRRHPHAGFAVLFSLAAAHWHIPLEPAVQGYLWSWTENQVAAAIKLIPLGQTAGQRILLRASKAMPAAAAAGLRLADEEIGCMAQRLAIGSALHEGQYSRLFRS
jgi:urease accessory protein